MLPAIRIDVASAEDAGLINTNEKVMNATIRQLKTLFFAIILLNVVVVILFETGLLPSGSWAHLTQLEFVVLSAMELITLLIIPVALRLFKFQWVHKQLVMPDKRWENLRRFGVLRLTMLLVPMVVCTILYYMFMAVALGYLAIILFLCLFFVYPSVDKCVAETTDDEN